MIFEEEKIHDNSEIVKKESDNTNCKCSECYRVISRNKWHGIFYEVFFLKRRRGLKYERNSLVES